MLDRIKALIGTPEALPIKAFVAYSMIGGYAMLVSYTWPLGFLPLVTLEALPIVLISFIPILMLVWLFLWILFYPLSVVTSTRFWAAQLHPGATFRDEEEALREAQKLIAGAPIRQVYQNMEETIPEWLLKLVIRDVGALSWLPSIGRAAAFGINVVLLGIVCAPSLALWYLVSASFPWNRGFFFIVIPLMFATLEWIRDAVRAHKPQGSAGPMIGLFIVLVALPALRFEHRLQGLPIHLGPNVLVAEALRLSGIGGGISVRIAGHSKSDVADSAFVGRLLFFDGVRAWAKPCNQPNEVVRIVGADSFSVFNDDICAPQ